MSSETPKGKRKKKDPKRGQKSTLPQHGYSTTQGVTGQGPSDRAKEKLSIGRLENTKKVQPMFKSCTKKDQSMLNNKLRKNR